MATHELTQSVSNGPLTSSSYLFGAVDGSVDSAPDAFLITLVYDYIKSRTDLLYPTLAQYNSVLDTANTALNQGGGYWLGQSMPTTGFADAVDATGLVTKSQAEAIATAAGVNYVGLPVLTDIDQDNDLIQIYDVSAAGYYSVTPAELRSDVGLGTEDSPTFSGLGLASGAVINWGDLTLTQSSGLLTLAGGNLAVPDDAYAAGWNGSANVPTKNAVYDKIELILGTTLPATYQPLDADLTAVAAFASTGIAVRTASNTWAQRSMANAAAGITWTNPAGVAGDFTPVLANDLAGLEGLGSTGFAVRSATDTWVQRSVAVSGAGLSISNGDGVSGNPTISLADDVAAIEALTPTNDDILQRKSGAWTNRTMAQLIADLAALGTTFQPLDSDLTSWAGVTRAAGFDTFTATPSVANLMSLLTDDASGLGTFMTTPSSANLAALLTDETGSGLAVFNNSPTFITPVLGVASATSVTVGNTGLIVGASTPFSDSAGTLTLQNVDALDATTESTIEAAIDTLANLTSIQGRTVTLADAGADAFLAWDDSASAYQNLSAADATAILNAFIGDSGSGGTKGLVPAPASGDSGKFLKGNGTWASVPGGGDALTSNPLSQFAATTSAQLAGVISDETGSGALVFATSPTLVTPVLGTPSSGTLTNCTGLPIGSGVSGLGSGIATFLATPSSANLRSAITDETGTGALVFATSPGFTTDASPASNDGASLGKSGTAWSDLYLASGGVINCNNGDFTLTHLNAVGLEVAGGHIYLADTNPTVNNVAGWSLRPNGIIACSADGGPAYEVNRKTSDGGLVNLRQDGTLEGQISVSGTTVTYGAFCGSHWARFADDAYIGILPGTILEAIEGVVRWKFATFDVDDVTVTVAYNGPAQHGDSVELDFAGDTYTALVTDEEPGNTLVKHVRVKVSDTANSSAVYGVFISYGNDDGWNDVHVAALGNYFIRMAAGQSPQIGDLVVSDGTGCGMVQDDGVIRSKTVAKVTNAIPQHFYDDGSYLVPCVLYCG